MCDVVFNKDAARSLLNIQRKQALTIQAKIAAVAVARYGEHNNVTKLQGRDGYRLRVGDWRVIYEIVDDRLIIHVVRIAVRGSAYKK